MEAKTEFNPLQADEEATSTHSRSRSAHLSTNSNNSKKGIIRSRKSGDHGSKSIFRESIDSLYPPDPADASARKSVLTGTAGFIIVTEFCERLAYYGFAGSLVLFFQTQLGYSNAEADVQYSAWSGVCYVTPLLGGYIADTYLGRYRAILVFCSIYLLGLVMVVIGSIPGDINPAFFFPAIYIVALGTGGIKPNVSTMGADQFDDRYSMDRRDKESFFNWFYWSINLGSLISYTVVAYICQSGIPQLGGEKWGFFLGYLIPAIAMGLAIFVFILGTPRYRIAKPQGSVLGRAMGVIVQAVSRYWANSSNKAVNGHSSSSSNAAPRLVDRASVTYGGSFSPTQVEGVALIMRLTPFLAVLVPFWGIYSQMSTAFQNQACQLDLNLQGGLQVPVSALNSFDTIAILLLVPVFDRYLYPLYKQQTGESLGLLVKMGLGFIAAMIAMFIAAIVEIARKDYAPAPGDYYDTVARDNITPCQSIDDYNPYAYQGWLAGTGDYDSQPLYCSQTCDYYIPNTQPALLNLTCINCDNIPQMSHLSVFWQIFQFSLIGVSEILASITSLEFFYSQAPTVMRSVAQSLNLATTSLGSFIVIPLLLIVNAGDQPWVPANLDDGHLDWYFFLLAALMGGTTVVFYFIARGYEYKTHGELAALEAEAAADEQDSDTSALLSAANASSAADDNSSPHSGGGRNVMNPIVNSKGSKASLAPAPSSIEEGEAAADRERQQQQQQHSRFAAVDSNRSEEDLLMAAAAGQDGDVNDTDGSRSDMPSSSADLESSRSSAGGERPDRIVSRG